MSYSYSELLSYFVGALGILMTVIYITYLKGKTFIRIFFSSYLLIASVTIILGALNYSGKIIMFPNLFRIDSPIHYLFPPVVFFYIYSSFKPGFTFKKIYLLNFLPFLINLIEFLPFYFSPEAEKIENINQLLEAGSVVMPMHYLLKDLNLTVYFIAQLYVFFKYKPDKNVRTHYQDSLVKWFWIFLSGQFLIIVGMTTEIVWKTPASIEPYHFGMNVTTLFVLMTSLAFLFFPRILYGNFLDEHSNSREKYFKSKLSENKKADILESLNLYLRSNKKPFLNPKLSLEEVSGKLSVLPKHLSQVINEKTGSNFNQYINEYRVEESKKILASPEYVKLKIEAIAQTAGFNSKSQFYEAFKKYAGMTPKQFADNYTQKSK
ncbi:MAG TPA: helix-turn-helix transcriptional regulator [Bacteroidales bacterium]